MRRAMTYGDRGTVGQTQPAIEQLIARGRVDPLVRQTAARIREMRREAARLRAAIDYEPAQSTAVRKAAQNLARRLTSGHNDDH